MAFSPKYFFNKKHEKKKIEAKVYNVEDYDETYVISKKILRYIAIQLADNYTKFISICVDLFFWFEFGNFIVFVPSEFFGIVIAASNAGSFNEAIDAFRMIPCFGSAVLSIFKSFKIFYNRPVYENIVKELRIMWPRGSVTEREHNILKRALQQLNLIVKGYFWCNNVLLISFLAPPFLFTAWRYLGHDNPMKLHFTYWLPFDPMQPVYYEIMLVLQTWQALVVIWFNVSWDMLFCTLISHITIQFDLLAVRIERLFYVEVDNQLVNSYPLASVAEQMTEINRDSIDTHNEKHWETNIKKELAAIVQRHRALIRLSEDAEAMFSLALLINFMNGSIMICFCGFCAILVEKWNDVAYKSFLLTTLSQTWLLCWYGQKLIDSSLGVSEALFNCGWYKAPKTVKSSIFIMLHRAQKSVHVTTYGFAVISLTSFTTIVKTSWSYFTLILNVYKK